MTLITKARDKSYRSERGRKKKDSGGQSSSVPGGQLKPLTSSWFSHAGSVASVTHRLYSAPRNKFSGFLHTLHSAGGRQRENNTGDECQG